MKEWLSYMPDNLYSKELCMNYGIDTNKIIHDNENNKSYFNNAILSIINLIDNENTYIYDCCCNVGSYCVVLSQYAKIVNGVDIEQRYIDMANYVAKNNNLKNCFFYKQTFFDINNKQWYDNYIKKIDILLCLSFGSELFTINKTTNIIHMVNLIQTYKPKYIIFHNMYHSKYIFSDKLSNFIKILSVKKYRKQRERERDINYPIWVFVRI